MSHDDRDPEIERLLRLAGARPVAPAAVEARVRTAVHAHWRAGLWARRRRKMVFWGAGLAAAAAGLLFVVRPAMRPSLPASGSGGARIATLVRVVGSPRTTPPAPDAFEAGASIAEGTAIETGPQDRTALLLSDGTALRVDRDTRIRLLPGPLVELDRGAVYAETAENARGGRTFRIETRLGVVRDVGTRFQVRFAEGLLTVSVRSGVARLERDGGAREAGRGSQLAAEKDGATALRSVPLSGPEWDWILSIAPDFDIEGRRLGEFLDWAAQETGFQVRFDDPAMKPHAVATILHGSVHGMRPDEALGAVLPTCGLRHDIEGDTIVVRRAENTPPSY